MASPTLTERRRCYHPCIMTGLSSIVITRGTDGSGPPTSWQMHKPGEWLHFLGLVALQHDRRPARRPAAQHIGRGDHDREREAEDILYHSASLSGRRVPTPR